MTIRKHRESSKRALAFSRIYIENWRNFRRVDLSLQRRVFLVGPNAAGKSNFLDLFRFLHDIVSVGGGFQEAVLRRGGVTALRSLAARRYPDIVLRATLGDEESPAEWEYELRFAQDNRQRPVVQKERVTFGGQEVFTRPTDEDRADPARLSQTYLEQVNVNREFRAVAEFFSSIRYLHIVPQLVREPARSVGRVDDPYGGDFLEQIAKAPANIQRSRLQRIASALRVAVPQLSEIELWRDVRGTPHLRGRYEHWRPQGAWQNEDQFSDGTLRLTGLLWSVLDGTGPLLLEEPELSLHPEVVRHLPQMFARIQRRTGRQTLLSTHSSELLQDTGIGLDEVLLLKPEAEGTSISTADAHDDVKHLLDGGLTLAEAIMPRVRPRNATQLGLFGDV